MVERKNYMNASVCVSVCVSRGGLRGAKMLIDSGAGDDGNYEKRQCYTNEMNCWRVFYFCSLVSSSTSVIILPLFILRVTSVLTHTEKKIDMKFPQWESEIWIRMG